MNNDEENNTILDDDLDASILERIVQYKREQLESKDYYSFCSEELLDYSLQGINSIKY